MWFNNGRWYGKKQLAGTQPTSGPHPLIGKTFKLDNDNPFEEYLCRVLDVKPNGKGEEWVKFAALLDSNVESRLANTLNIKTFTAIWKEI